MTFEVEQKFRLTQPSQLVAQLSEMGASLGEVLTQKDQYFAHPCRDFSQSDEALRIRQVGTANWITYKGPKLDTTTKTRREIELPLGNGDAAAAAHAELLQSLGFQPVRVVSKQRQTAKVDYAGRVFEVALDQVAEVGTFAEVETLAEADELEAAKSALHELAAKLELCDIVRRSYLALLIDATT